MMKSEQEPKTLYESFLLPKLDRSVVEEQIKFQNKVIGVCLVVLLVGAIGLLCLLIL